MAKEAKLDAANSDAGVAAPARSSKKLIVLIAAALVLLACVAGGAFFMIKSQSNADDEGDEPVEKSRSVKKSAKDSVPVYVPLEAFTVNLTPENGDQFLQLMLTVEVTDSQVGERMKMYTPKVRNNMMMLLSSKRASELLTTEGKQTLANEIRDLINEVLGGGDAKSDDGPVREVLFTSFIIQ